MAIKIIKEVSRDGGRLPATGASILAGDAIQLNAAGEVLPYANTGAQAHRVWGLASDSNVTQPLQGAGGLTVGVGFDYTNFNRGGLIGAFMNGGVYELYNDGSGNPMVIGGTYVVNEPVYSDTSGKITEVDGFSGASLLGTVVSVSNAGSATAMRLQLKLLV